ncbi:hypothetical protein V470_10975 [Streptococcus sp. VT 162]|nr:hypothetical protein V470_10975 [Streptococcus sp. VT 162]
MKALLPAEFDLESDVRYFEVTGWSGFLMESVSTWGQVEIFRLTAFSNLVIVAGVRQGKSNSSSYRIYLVFLFLDSG